MPRLCPSALTLVRVEQHNVSRLQVLLAGVLPVGYPDSFYKSIVKGKVCAVLAQEGDRVTGGMAWNTEGDHIHLLALGVIGQCRRRGVASRLLEHLLQQEHLPVFLYVQTENSDAIEFYRAKGFHSVAPLENYYRRVTCTAAHRMLLDR